MKVYFYRKILNNQEIEKFHQQAVKKHNLQQQYQYFIDIVEHLAAYETSNPNDADYFFVPLFIAGWQFENIDPDRFGIIKNHVKYLSRGRHILVGTGDFGQRYQSKSEMQGHPTRAYRDKYSWLDDRFLLIALESTEDLHEHDIAFFPYMTHPLPEPVQERDLLCSFKGALTYPQLPPSHVRGGRLAAHASLLRSEGICIYGSGEAQETAAQSSRDLMLRSTFTLVPAGYGQWSFRLMEALNAGSIPVLLADSYVLPFQKKIEWKKLSVRFREESLADLPKLLSSIPKEEIQLMQNHIAASRNLFSKNSCLSFISDELDRQISLSPVDWVMPRMRSPSEMGIICIDITNKCDLACSNCTRLLENQDHFWEMTSENFRRACQSLRSFPGVIAVIGGNPCMHSRFEEITRIFEEEIPERRRRGIWTNNAFKHAALLEEKYGAFNLNPHGVERGIKSLKPIHDKMVASGKFSGGYYDTNSEHAPLLVAGKDIFDPKTMWARIANCDVNKNWSAAIVQNKGKLRAYFCEVAASFDLARNEDHGLPVTDGWWTSRMDVFKKQVDKFCPGCGAPARIKGNIDRDEIDGYSKSNSDLAIKAHINKKRKIALVESSDIDALGHQVTKYQANAR